MFSGHRLGPLHGGWGGSLWLTQMLLAPNVGVMQASIVGGEDSGIWTTLCIMKLLEPYQAPLACMFQPPPTGL